MSSDRTRRVTLHRRLPTPDVLAQDAPLPDRLFIMADKALAGLHREEVEEEIRTALAILDPHMKKGRQGST